MKYTVSLKKNYEFQRLYKRGKYFVGKYMVMYAIGNRKEANRLGISLGKKFGNSVQRNRAKRLIRENYRFYEDYIKKGYDLVILARTSEQKATFADIKKEMKYLMKKLDIFEQELWACSKGQL